jgi:phosphate/phosphite/phosphonate ABC transporter binding protein
MEASQGSSTRVGRYHLVERLAVGGMAEVFLACERGSHALDRLLVIKRILPHLADNAIFVQMFMSEARLAARINHPNVVQIYELGESGGFPFIAMEYVSGSTLKELLHAANQAGTRLPIGAVVHLMAQACAGTHAAHELRGPNGQLLNLVHRDLSPHNLMVTDRGLVKLLDFGIAKAEQGVDNTRTGMLKGKVSYMSPEQCKQLHLDRRSDNYALGFVLWELLAGQKMFQGMSELATMQAIVTGQLKDLREVRRDVPHPILAVLQKALQSDPAERYQTADAMRRDLLLAAERSNVEVDEDKTQRLVRTLLGEVHELRRKAVTAALEKTLVTLSRLQSGDDVPGGRSLTATHRTMAPSVATTTAVGGLSLAIGVAGTAMFGLLALFAAWSLALGPFGAADDGMPPLTHPDGPSIKITLAPSITPSQLLEDLEPLRRHLQITLDRPVQFTVAGSYQDASVDVVSGNAHFALLPYNTLLNTLANDPELEVLAHEVVDGSEASDGYLVVPRTSKAESMRDLVGSTICYTDKLSSTGYKLPRAYLERQGLDPDADFVTHFSGDHQQVLRDIIGGVCAVGGTYSGNFSTATQAGIPVARLRILVPRTGSTPHDGWIASRSADPTVKQALTDALVDFDPMRDLGRERLGEKKRITGYVRPEPEWLEPPD